MTHIKGTFGTAGTDDVEFDIDLEEHYVETQYLAPVTEERAVLDDEGNATGETTTEVVTPSRVESIEEAVVRVLRQQLELTSDLERTGVSNVTATIRYTISGSFDFDAIDFGAEGLDELDPETDDAEDFIVSNFDEQLQEAARESGTSSWESELEIEVEYAEFVQD